MPPPRTATRLPRSDAGTRVLRRCVAPSAPGAPESEAAAASEAASTSSSRREMSRLIRNQPPHRNLAWHGGARISCPPRHAKGPAAVARALPSFVELGAQVAERRELK